MKTIHIFLASSIREFEREREQIELFLRNVSDHFEKKYQIQIRPILCENIDPAFTTERKQEEYNRIIRSCETVFFIFYTKLGEFTLEEFLVAKSQFEAYGSPKIYTYFKNLQPGETMEQSLADFMDRLDHTFGHYHSTFDHLDTVKLRMLLSIQLQQQNFAQVRTENGHCYIDDIPVLSLEHVAEFRNNGPLQELLQHYSAQEAEYLRIKSQYATEQNDPQICREYAQVCAKRETLCQEIRKLQDKILRITLNICSGQLNGNVTPRQKEAYRLFEQGNLVGCMQILDSADIDREYMAGEKLLEALTLENAQKFIREHMTAIDILSTMIQNPHRYKEIYERYQKVIPVIKKHGIETEVFFKYCAFLTDTGRYWDAKQFLKELIAFCKAHPEKFPSDQLGRAYLSYGDYFTQIRLHSEARRAYRKALKYFKASSERLEATAEAMEKLTGSVLAIGQAYRRQCTEDSIGLKYRIHPYTYLYRLLQKRSIRRLDAASIQLLEQAPTNANQLLRARVHDHYARFYEHHRNKRCIHHYLQALSIAENCQDADRFVERCLQSIVFFYWLTKPSDEITPYLDRLISIREKQFHENPDQYYFALYTAYYIACLQRIDNENDPVLFMYCEKLLRISSAFHERMTALADADVASYIRLSDGHNDWFLMELAEEYPDAIPKISGAFHDFHSMIQRW